MGLLGEDTTDDGYGAEGDAGGNAGPVGPVPTGGEPAGGLGGETGAE